MQPVLLRLSCSPASATRQAVFVALFRLQLSPAAAASATMATSSSVMPPRGNGAPTALNALPEELASTHHNLLAKQGALMLRPSEQDEYAGLVLVRPSVITFHLLIMHVCP